MSAVLSAPLSSVPSRPSLGRRSYDLLLTARFQFKRRVGVTGTLVLLAAGLALACAVQAQRLHEKSAALIQQAQRPIAPTIVQVAASKTTAADQLPSLLPPLSRNAQDLTEIIRLAADAQITLSAAQYQMTHLAGGELVRYEIVLPVKERYPSIRAFIAAVLNEIPYASLEEIHVERPKVGSDVLDTRIRLNLFYREH